MVVSADIALCFRNLIPFQRFFIVLFRTAAEAVHITEPVLRFRVTGLGFLLGYF